MDSSIRVTNNSEELCLFSIRHHTNPVGTEWRWKMDQPEMILQEAIENHQNMIKQFKGNFSHFFPVNDAFGR